MTIRYRILWLIPDPYSGGRIPLGALVDRDGRVSFAVAEPPSFQGAPPEVVVLGRIAIEELKGARHFHELPAALGPQVVAGDPVSVPLAVSDQWLAQRVLRAA